MSKDFNVTNTTVSYGKYYDVGKIVENYFQSFLFCTYSLSRLCMFCLMQYKDLFFLIHALFCYDFSTVNFQAFALNIFKIYSSEIYVFFYYRYIFTLMHLTFLLLFPYLSRAIFVKKLLIYFLMFFLLLRDSIPEITDILFLTTKFNLVKILCCSL